MPTAKNNIEDIHTSEKYHQLTHNTHTHTPSTLAKPPNHCPNHDPARSGDTTHHTDLDTSTPTTTTTMGQPYYRTTNHLHTTQTYHHPIAISPHDSHTPQTTHCNYTRPTSKHPDDYPHNVAPHRNSRRRQEHYDEPRDAIARRATREHTATNEYNRSRIYDATRRGRRETSRRHRRRRG